MSRLPQRCSPCLKRNTTFPTTCIQLVESEEARAVQDRPCRFQTMPPKGREYHTSMIGMCGLLSVGSGNGTHSRIESSRFILRIAKTSIRRCAATYEAFWISNCRGWGSSHIWPWIRDRQTSEWILSRMI